jgi:radical SAM protein with 4Fe4S-binding SPASM domain
MNLLRKLKNQIETNRFLSFLFDRLAQTKIYRSFIFNKINEFIDQNKTNRQYNITIETSNFCNASCVMCPHRHMKRHQSLMSQITFKQITQKIIDEKINPNVFILNGFGEPLTDPHIFTRIQYFKKLFPKTPIKFYSNLYLASPPIIQKLISSGLDEINISLNGYDTTSYQKTMGLKYSQTIQNLKELIRQKDKLHSSLKIRISMTLISQNKKQINLFLKKWQSLVDSVSVNKVHDYQQSVDLSNQKFKINFHKKTFPCKNIWNSLVFDADGNLVICCLDYESQYQFGGIKDPILSSFFSKKFNNLRQLHLSSKIQKVPICQQCYTPYKNGIEWLINKIY